jgi:hypothetical protein
MHKGFFSKEEYDYAVKKAQENFDKWNSSSELVNKRSIACTKVKELIAEAVEIGARISQHGR